MVRLTLAAIASRRCLPSLLYWMSADMARKDPKWVGATLEQLSLTMRCLRPGHVPVPPVLTDGAWGSLQVPVLFLVGGHEVIYSAEKAMRRLKRVAPGVHAEIIPVPVTI